MYPLTTIAYYLFPCCGEEFASLKAGETNYYVSSYDVILKTQGDKIYRLEEVGWVNADTWYYNNREYDKMYRIIPPEMISHLKLDTDNPWKADPVNFSHVNDFHMSETQKAIFEQHIKKITNDKITAASTVKVRDSIDNIRLLYLSRWIDKSTGEIVKYCLDVEEADDSHYEFYEESIPTLRALLGAEKSTVSIIVLMALFASEHGSGALEKTVGMISSAQFHYS